MAESRVFSTRCRFCGKPITMSLAPGENWRATEVRDGRIVDHKPICPETRGKRQAARAAAERRDHPKRGDG
jgi:hypothetical protein